MPSRCFRHVSLCVVPLHNSPVLAISIVLGARTCVAYPVGNRGFCSWQVLSKCYPVHWDFLRAGWQAKLLKSEILGSAASWSSLRPCLSLWRTESETHRLLDGAQQPVLEEAPPGNSDVNFEFQNHWPHGLKDSFLSSCFFMPVHLFMQHIFVEHLLCASYCERC